MFSSWFWLPCLSCIVFCFLACLHLLPPFCLLHLGPTHLTRNSYTTKACAGNVKAIGNIIPIIHNIKLQGKLCLESRLFIPCRLLCLPHTLFTHALTTGQHWHNLSIVLWLVASSGCGIISDAGTCARAFVVSAPSAPAHSEGKRRVFGKQTDIWSTWTVSLCPKVNSKLSPQGNKTISPVEPAPRDD